jgi:4-oxalocrotonate tautomerase
MCHWQRDVASADSSEPIGCHSSRISRSPTRQAPAIAPRSQIRNELTMPLIQVKLLERVFTDGQKKEIVKKLTDAMVSIEGESMRSVTWVLVEEVGSGHWGIGGEPLTTEDVKALAAGRR